jgi:hypothetical protein
MKDHKSRLDKIEKVLGKTPPVVLLMPGGKTVEIRPLPGETTLQFTMRLWNSPISSEAALIANNRAILQQPGHLIEVIVGALRFKRALLLGRVGPDECPAEPRSAWEQAGLPTPLTEQQFEKLRAEEEKYTRLSDQQQWAIS